jgi:RHS repeat-associated protein
VNTIAFSYSGLGNRIKKSCTHSPSSYYALDPNGNTLAMYTKEVGGSYELEELYTYGSSRLGAVKYRNNAPLGHSALEAVESFLEYGAVGNGSSLGAVCYTEPISRAKFLGYKTYELSNHLGNVLSVVQDYKQHRFNPQNPSEAWNYMPICNSFNDYYPFGMVMPGRTFSGSNDYRYGFIGAENDNEIAGQGNSQDHKYRSYDPRLGRYKSLDPLFRDYPWNSPYAYAENRVIDGIDLEGLEYISFHHYANGAVGKTEFYKMTADQIKRLGGTTAGIHNSVPYGAGGKGVVHYYYMTKEKKRQPSGSNDKQAVSLI